MDGELFTLDEEQVKDEGPVTCLGITFENDNKRREFFREELRKKLPELRLIEGFPIGEDDDIIALSDPPYYTACPNPWINDFIKEWEAEKVKLQAEGKRRKQRKSPPFQCGQGDIDGKADTADDGPGVQLLTGFQPDVFFHIFVPSFL